MPSFWSSVGDILWYSLTFFVFISYLMALFSIIGDLFRDRALGGGMKAVWLFFLIARGSGMAERAAAQARQAKEATDDYIRSVAGSPSEEIARAKSLLDAGTISAEEYASIKAKVLA